MSSSHLRNVWLIARREYLQQVKTKAFIIGTILMPLILAASFLLPGLFIGRGGGEKKIVIVASTADTGQAILEQISRRSGVRSDERREQRRSAAAQSIRATLEIQPTPERRQQLIERVEKKEIDGFLWATDDALATRKLDFVSRETTNLFLAGTLEGAVSSAQTKRRLAARGLSAEETEDLLKHVSVTSLGVEKGQARRGGGMAAFLASLMLMMVLYLVVLTNGIGVMRAVIEEKNSRVMEVLLSSCTALELMSGKLLGVGAVGMTQIAIWIATGLLLSAPATVAMSDAIRNANLGLGAVVFFPVFYVLGFLIYSAIYAALGASVNSEQEAQQLQFLAMIPLIAASIFMTPVATSPSSGLAVGLSLFPLTAPLMMYLRIVVSTPPAWQVALSIALQLAAIFALLWLASRIYRIGILMYGKRPTLPEILKWVRYA